MIGIVTMGMFGGAGQSQIIHVEQQGGMAGVAVMPHSFPKIHILKMEENSEVTVRLLSLLEMDREQ